MMFVSCHFASIGTREQVNLSGKAKTKDRFGNAKNQHAPRGKFARGNYYLTVFRVNNN